MEHLLIVNADDYGLTPGVSAGIRRAALEGIVTSTTAMMNQPGAAGELPKAFSQCPALGIGVHLSLTVGRPLLPANQVPSLVDTNGCFFRQQAFIENLPRINPDEAAAEWNAQVEKFIQLTGKIPDHLDSLHHSSYFTPALFERFLTLAARLDCPIRFPYDTETSSPSEFLHGGPLDEQFLEIKQITAKFQPRRPQHFCIDFYDESATLPQLLEIIEQVAASPWQSWELMCHPAEVDVELRNISSYSDARANELLALTDPCLLPLLAQENIRLVSFPL